MKLPQIDLLWSENKTRELFRLHIKLFLIGGIATNIFAFTVPLEEPLKTYAVVVPLLFNISAPFYFLTLNKKNIGFWFLLFILETQLLAAVFMAVTGGFQSVSQFGSFEILILTLFELGVQAALILSVFAIGSFFGIFLFLYNANPDPVYISQFIFYTIAYILVVIILRNIGYSISQQFEVRDKLKQLNVLKNQFITLTSHHLRTPITIIKGYIEILERDLTNTDKKLGRAEDHFERINKAIKDLQYLLEKLLFISSFVRDSKEFGIEKLDIEKLILVIVDENIEKASFKNIELKFESIGKIEKYEFDKKILTAAINEIIDNAIKFSKPGAEVRIKLYKKSSNIVIEVTDTGIGIKKKDIDQLFTPFFHANVTEKNYLAFDHEGIGLGLFIANLAVSAYDGKISVDSTRGKGSTFTIKLPINPIKS